MATQRGSITSHEELFPAGAVMKGDVPSLNALVLGKFTSRWPREPSASAGKVVA